MELVCHQLEMGFGSVCWCWITTGCRDVPRKRFQAHSTLRMGFGSILQCEDTSWKMIKMDKLMKYVGLPLVRQNHLAMGSSLTGLLAADWLVIWVHRVSHPIQRGHCPTWEHISLLPCFPLVYWTSWVLTSSCATFKRLKNPNNYH